MKLNRHVDPETVYDLLDGELDPARERAVEAHLWRCERCRALHEECGATLAALRWYGTVRPEPPAGYWEGFWTRWSGARSWAPRRVLVPLAAAATLAALAGGWLASRPGAPADLPAIATPAVPSARTAIDDPEWARDYEFFERASIALGSVDPLSKGIVLAGLAGEP